MSSKQETIFFDLTEDDIPVIESRDNFENSIFCEQYNKFDYEVKRFLEERTVQKRKKHNISNESINNIFSFIGDRGAGKTSCMLSVANDLIEHGVNSYSFTTIDMIEPEYFDNNHNIISLLLAQLFKKFQENEYINKTSLENKFEIRQDLIESFSRVQKDLSTIIAISGQFDTDDNIENLVSLAGGVNLKKSFHELINKYLNYFSETQKESILLIMIDDIDLNTECADIMMEQIRKYLIQDNILILISVKLDQLLLVKQQQLMRNYQIYFSTIDKLEKNDKSKDILLLTKVKNMAEAYLEKFLPLTHRIYMPDFKAKMNSSIQIKYENVIETGISVAQKTLELIFNKTRYLFYNSEESISPVLPINLRELRHLIKFLYRLPEYDNNEQIYNKILFKKYFFEDWCNKNLQSDDYEKISVLLRTEIASQINVTVLGFLRNYLQGTDIVRGRPTIDSLNREFSYIFDKSNVFHNISIGDVLSVILSIEESNCSESIRNFLFAIKTFYSIRLYEYYDELTEIQNNNKISDTRKVFKFNSLQNISNYERLVGGLFFNTKLYDFLPSKNGKLSRSIRPIDGALLSSLIKDCIDNYDRRESIKDYTNKFKLTEFLILCSSRNIDTKNRNSFDFIEPMFRRNSNLFYSENFDKKNICFDIGSFLFNISRLEKTYSRFENGDKFFQLANQPTTDSLINDFRKELVIRDNNNEAEFDNNRWLSFACVRNFEILQDLFHYLQKFIDKDYKSGDDITILQKFFHNLSQYSIKTYDYIDKGQTQFYKISFSFSRCIANLLSHVKISSENLQFNRESILKNSFESIFSEIYNSALNEQKEENTNDFLSNYYLFRPNFISLQDIGTEIKTVEDLKKKVYSTYPKIKLDKKLSIRFTNAIKKIKKEINFDDNALTLDIIKQIIELTNEKFSNLSEDSIL